MQKLRTLDEVTEGYFRDHPEEIDKGVKDHDSKRTSV